MRIVILTIACLLGIGAGGQSLPKPRPPALVSMIALIANPSAQAGRLVRIVGFLSMRSGQTRIFLHEEDYVHQLINNSVELYLTANQQSEFLKLHRKYVYVDGIVLFGNGAPRHATLGKVQRIEVWADSRQD